MRTNKTQSYAMACIRELANQQGDFVQVSDIARKHGLPAAYCQKILLTLSRSGIVESMRGRGFTLARPAGDVTLETLVKALSLN